MDANMLKVRQDYDTQDGLRTLPVPIKVGQDTVCTQLFTSKVNIHYL